MSTITYKLRTVTGDTLNLSNIPYGMTLEDEVIRVYGSPGEDRIYVGPGLNLDLTVLGLGNDRIYFTGSLSDYTQTIDQDSATYVFSHNTRPSEIVRVQSMGQNDVLYFADGHFVFNANDDARLYNADTWESFAITGAMLEPGGTPVPQSDATITLLGISNDSGASGSDFITSDDNGLTISASLSRPLESLESQGAVGATLPMRVFIKGLDGADIPYLGMSGQAMQIVGSAGVDNIYVGLGVAVDARVLGRGDDRVYFTGQLSEYTQSIDQDTGVYTFTHNTRSTEVVQVTSMGQNDELWFADGHIVFNALDDVRLYDAIAEQFVAIDTGWLSVGGSPLVTEKLQYSSDGGATWQDVNEAIGLDGTTITLNDPTLTSSANIQFRVSNQTSSGAVSSQQVTIDTVAPATPAIGLIAGDDDIAAAERPTATVQGTSEANAIIELSFSGGFSRTTQANGSGNWSYSLTGADLTAMGLGAETVAATATDLAGNTNGAQDSRAFNVQSLDVTAPEITGPSGAAGAASSVDSVAENATAVHTFTANETVTWSLNGGADAAQFSINATTGALIFQAAPDFEAPADGGADNTYTVVVRAVDTAGNASDQSVAITVTNEVDTVPVFTSAASVSVFENMGTVMAVYNAQTNVEGGDGATYTLGGADAGLFNINASTGAVTFQANPSVAADTAYHIEVTATNAAGSDLEAVAITVRDIAATLNLGTWGNLIAPVQVDGGQVYYFWDRSGDGTSAGVDYATHNFLDAIFQYDVNGVLETAGNAVGAVGDTDNIYRYANLNGVQVALPTYGSTLSGINADNLGYLNGTAIDNSPVGEVNTTYDDLLAIWDAHNGAGTGTGSSGIPAGWVDYYYWSATPTAGGHAVLYPGNNSYVFDAGDSDGNYMALQVVSQITSASTANVFEDAATSKVVYDADGFTVLGDSTLTWSLLGTDAARFTIDADDGEVRFVASPDFEAPVDAGGNNVYDITVRGTTSSGAWVDKDVALTVRDIVATLDLGTWGQLIAPVQVDGGQLYYVWDRNSDGVIDGAGSPLDYVTHDFLDAIFKYNINGELETAGNAVGAVGDTDNTFRYAILNGLQVALPTYGGTMSGINATSFGFQNGTAIDNSPVGEVNPTYDGLLAIWDAHNGAGTGTGSNGVPAGWNDGYYYWAATPSAAGHAGVNPANGHVNDYGDGTNSFMALQVVSLLSQITSTGTATAAENTLTSAVVYDANGFTSLGNGMLTWSVLGADAARFTIDADDGEVRFVTSPNFEAPVDAGGNNVYDITVRGTASNGSWVDKAVAITVTNTNDNSPYFTSASNANFAENGTGTAYTISAIDADALNPMYYYIEGGDSWLFDYNSSTGAVSFKNAPNFEAPADAGGNNVYNFDIVAWDGNNFTSAPVFITVTNTNDNYPYFTSASNANFAENGTGTAYTITAIDADALNPMFYYIEGGDATLFDYNSSTGAVSFKNAPNFEAPADAGGNNVYNFDIVAWDGNNFTSAPVFITVTNVAERGDPVIDLGTWGKLINQVVVDGGQVYYAWDWNGDGVHNDTPVGGKTDEIQHEELDAIFKYDVNGVLETAGNAVGEVGDTDNTYRYATLNGVQVALPVYGGPMSGIYANPSPLGEPGTAIDNDPVGEVNPTYDGMLAIWDAYNGSGTGTSISGVPSGWDGTHYFTSATPGATTNQHNYLQMLYGSAQNNSDIIYAYVALQVL